MLPGPVETPILVDFEKSIGKDTLDGLKNLLGRHATPTDIASVVLFPRLRHGPLDQRPSHRGRRRHHRCGRDRRRCGTCSI